MEIFMVFGAIVSDDINCAQFRFYAFTKVLVFINYFCDL
jgi:hypothetical protein